MMLVQAATEELIHDDLELNDVLSLIHNTNVESEFGEHIWEEVLTSTNVQALSDLLSLLSIRLNYVDTGRRNYLRFIRCKTIDNEFGEHLWEEVSDSYNSEALTDLLMLTSIRLKALRPHSHCSCDSPLSLVLQSSVAGIILFIAFVLFWVRI